MIRRWLREPLVHFLALGAVLFAVSHWRDGPGSASSRILITPGQIDSLVAVFSRTWMRPPTELELKRLVDESVREEIAAREAAAIGLDRDDTVIKRRLRQKLEFLAEDGLDQAPVTDAELQAWFEKHPDRYQAEPEVAFRQLYLSPDRRGETIEPDAKALLAKLAAAGRDVGADLGDPSMLPRDVERSTRSSIAGQFGEQFAEAVMKIEPGRWAGPVRSGYGLHLVWVEAQQAGRMPALDEVRPEVERDVAAERRRQRIDAMYVQLLSRYKVVVEQRRAHPQGDGAAAAPGPGSR